MGGWGWGGGWDGAVDLQTYKQISDVKMGTRVWYHQGEETAIPGS